MNMNVVHPGEVKVSVRLRRTTPSFEVSPQSARFLAEQTRGIGDGYARLIVDEIETAVGALAGELGLQKSRYMFLPGADHAVRDCAGLIIVPWRHKRLVQQRLIGRGYFYTEAEEVAALDTLLEPFEDRGQRYRAEYDLGAGYCVIADREGGRGYDPKALFEIASSEYHQVWEQRRVMDARALISDLGGVERASAIYFFRMRGGLGDYALRAASSNVSSLNETGFGQ